MSKSISIVELHATHVPTLPHMYVCVRCGARFPNHTTRLVTRDARLGVLFWLGWLRIEVPAYTDCAVAMHLRRGWNVIRLLAVSFGFCAIGLEYLLPRFSDFVTGVMVLGSIAVRLILVNARDELAPQPFELERIGDVVQYTFRNRELAETFASANGARSVNREWGLDGAGP